MISPQSNVNFIVKPNVDKVLFIFASSETK